MDWGVHTAPRAQHQHVACRCRLLRLTVGLVPVAADLGQHAVGGDAHCIWAAYGQRMTGWAPVVGWRHSMMARRTAAGFKPPNTARGAAAGSHCLKAPSESLRACKVLQHAAIPCASQRHPEQQRTPSNRPTHRSTSAASPQPPAAGCPPPPAGRPSRAPRSTRSHPVPPHPGCPRQTRGRIRGRWRCGTGATGG